MDSLDKSVRVLERLGFRLKFENAWSEAFLFYNTFSLFLWSLMAFNFMCRNIRDLEANLENASNFAVSLYALIAIVAFYAKRQLLEKILLDIKLLNSNGTNQMNF